MLGGKALSAKEWIFPPHTGIYTTSVNTTNSVNYDAFRQFKSRKYGVYNEGTPHPKLTATVSVTTDYESACPCVRHSPEAPFASRTYAAETTKRVVPAVREAKGKRRKAGGRVASWWEERKALSRTDHPACQAPAFSVRVPQRARRAVSRPKHARTHARGVETAPPLRAERVSDCE